MTRILKRTVASSTNLQAALHYAKHGFPVLPVWPLRNGRCACPDGEQCKTPGKHPMMKDWPKRATTDEAKLRAIFARTPDAHVGITPPEEHTIFDIDPRNGGIETWRARQLPEPEFIEDTPVQRSGGGGYHILYRGVRNGTIGKGVDVIAHRRKFVVAWPSAHISGKKYEWCVPYTHSIEDMPEELDNSADTRFRPETTNPTTPPDTDIKVIREALAYVPADDYQRWINVGQALRHAYGQDGYDLWVEWSKTSAKYEEGDEDRWETFDQNRDRPLITVRSVVAMARQKGYRPLTREFDKSLWIQGDTTGMLETPAPEIQWAFEPCMPLGKVTVIAGAGGSSKSFLTLTLAMQLALCGEMGMFKCTRAGRALLMVGEEDRNDIHRRLQAVHQSQMFTDEQVKCIQENIGVVSVRGLDWRLMFHDEHGDLQETSRVDYLIEEIRTLGDVRMLVLDPLVMFNGGDENDNAQMSRLMFTLDRIASETNCAVVVVHHVSKGGQVLTLDDMTQSAVRGASALVDNARSALLMARMPRKDAPLFNISGDDAGRFVVVRLLKNNYGAHAEDCIFAVERGGALRYAPEVRKAHSTLAAANKAGAASNEQALETMVLQLLYSKGKQAVNEVCEVMKKSRRDVYNVLQKLKEQGMVELQGAGRNTAYALTDAGQKQIAGDEDLL